ncbi:hypothetical protein ABT009_40895 [Streptomyces sp. NPDC002896]|uniref:hypothetical protein n=1 Tax=Streptomyces sp. NPDC002896 TaxID=3154438 RepID=UPI0033279EE0
MSAATVMPIAHQNAPWKAPVAPCSRSDWKTMATIAIPNEAATCWAMRVFMVACGMSPGRASWYTGCR